MECNHGSRSEKMACRMSCCHDQDHLMTGMSIFVLPEPMTIFTAPESTSGVPETQMQVIAHLFEPPSPPPRIHSLIA